MAAIRRASVFNVRELPSLSNSLSAIRAAAWAGVPAKFQRSHPGMRCRGWPLQTAQPLHNGAREGALSWPNNSLSSSPVGIAAQFSLTKALEQRGLRSWKRGDQFLASAGLAINEYGGTSGGDRFDARSTARIASLRPMISSKLSRFGSHLRGKVFPLKAGLKSVISP